MNRMQIVIDSLAGAIAAGFAAGFILSKTDYGRRLASVFSKNSSISSTSSVGLVLLVLVSVYSFDQNRVGLGYALVILAALCAIIRMCILSLKILCGAKKKAA